MLHNREKLYQVYHTILCIALTLALSLAVNGYFVLKVNIAVCVLYSLVPAALVYLFDSNRKNTLSYLILISIIPALGLFFLIRKLNPITWIKGITRWVSEYDRTEETYKAAPAYYVLLAVSLLAVIIFYLLMKKQFAKIALALIILAMLIILTINKISLSKTVIGISIFYMLSILVEICGKLYSIKFGKPEKRAGILYLAPICLMLALVSVGLPSRPEPIQWKGVKFIYNSIKDRIDNIITDWRFFAGKGSGEFTLSLTGYSDEGSGTLGKGSISQDSKVALRVSGAEGNAPAYLIGSVSDIYTGNSWEKNKSAYVPGEKEYNLDYIELYYALSRQDVDMLKKYRYVDQKTVKIEYDNIRTRTLFYPDKSSWYELISKKTKQPDTETASMVFPKSAGNGTTYQMIYFEMNLQSERFIKLLKDSDSFSYSYNGDMNAQTMKYLRGTVFYGSKAEPPMSRWDFYELLGQRADLINQKYTVLPDTLPDRVRELAVSITKDSDTQYDKLKAIEKYLIDNYKYSLTPGALPEGKDFVDYFLFENKQGYCTSFASAMAVLARCVGIPARYAEGYVLDYTEKEGGDTFVVRNNKAHSWAEAYFEGVGWIPFEATPPYYSKRYIPWREYVTSESSAPAGYIPAYEEPTPGPLVVGGHVLDITKKKEVPGVLIGAVIILATTFIILLLLVIYYIVLKLKYRKAFEKSDYGRRMYLLFLRILTRLKREGFNLEPQETILMLAKRIRDIYHYDKVTFADVAEVFMRYRYAEAEITKKDFKKVETFFRGLENDAREKKGRFKMQLEEFIFLARKNYR